MYIAAAKVSTAVLGAAGVPHAEVRGLAIWSALAGAMLLPLCFWLYRRLLDDASVAAWAAVVTACSPLVWFNALRPLSDLAGLAVVVVAQALLVDVIFRRSPGAAWRLAAGALVAGLAIGVRSQTFVLTLPLLGLALVSRGPGLRARDRLVAVAALAAGGLAWAVPLLVASGGLEAYLVALASQGGEDFSGVLMLWTSPSPRVAATALVDSLLWPWGTIAAGAVVVAVAVAGAARMLWRAPMAFGTLLVAFVPYAVFHLLFHETVTTRYALPLVLPVAVLAVYAAAGIGRAAVHGAGAALVAWSLYVAVPAGVVYAGQPSPAAAAVSDAVSTAGAADTIADARLDAPARAVVSRQRLGACDHPAARPRDRGSRRAVARRAPGPSSHFSRPPGGRTSR